MHIFTTKDNHESKKAKGINKNIDDDELKHEDYKIFWFNRSYMRHKINRTQAKIIIQDCIDLIIFLSSYHDENYILKDGYNRLSHFH